MIFCTLPSGKFPIGRGHGDEAPIHFREFSSFQVGQFEVTQSQFTAVMGTAPWLAYRGPHGELPNTTMMIGQNFPAVWVTYQDATRFAKLLNELDSKATYRLLSEAEFEYAAYGGNKFDKFPWGDTLNPDYIFYSGNNISGKNYAHPTTSCPNEVMNLEIPGYCANSFGLYHMLGNVSEWTADVYLPNYYIPGTRFARKSGHDYPSPYGDGQPITYRGSSISTGSSADILDPRTRNHAEQHDRFLDNGFRIARIPN